MADEQEIKDLKIKRRTAKARVTRLSNALQNLLDSERDLEEVTELFQDLDVAYQQLEVKHERYCEVIDDDEAFLKEDEWLAECQASFLDMRKRVKDYGKTKDSSERQTEASFVNTETNPQEETAVRSEEVSSCKVQVERPKLPRFTGDVRDYMTFKSDFKHLIESRYSKRDAITILRSSLVGKPLDLIRGLGNDYDAAWAHLDNIYGDPRQVADAIVYDLGKFRPLKEGEDGRFCDFVHLIRRSYNSLQEVGRVNDMDNNHMISLIERKLSSDDRKLWLRFIDRERTDASLHALLCWMEMELKTRIRASAPLRDSRSTTVNHLSKNENSGERKPDFKCWLCKSSDHWVDQCKKVLSKSQEERFKLMKDNRACFSCLKRAGKDHNLKTCKRRKRCNERNNAGEQCTSFHHPLLHRQIQSGSVDIASVTGTFSLLPVVKIKMMGPNAGNYQGNCLLDSGAQMSLVRKAVAEELGLKGKPIVVNVTKVGGDTEEYRTMLYKMRVQGLDSNQSYNVSAVGLDVINDNIAEVNMEELAQAFSLRKEDVNREGGSIDVLIGIDHPKVHVGQTKTQGNLVARHSPLGWVIFGKTTDDFSEGAVLHITLSNPVDLREFWTTEGMGVCHDPLRCQANKMTKQEDEEFRIINSSVEKVENQWLIPYPWRKDPNLLKNNRKQAMRMLHATERKLSKNPEYAEAYDKQIQEMVKMGFARKLSDEEAESYQGPIHYISHHAVIRPEKKSTPIRIVFNSSALFEGESLNDFWLKGPDLLNSLFRVMLRFRERKVALCGDISKMFHRVKIPLRDQHVHRFLWRNLEQERKPDTYIMQVVTFGDKPSPAMAQIALRKTAEEGAKRYPAAANALLNDTYMDDICTSTDTRDEAQALAEDINRILANGGFRVKGWTSNTQLRGAESEMEKTLMESLGEEKVLGVFWDRKMDEFSYSVKIENFLDKKTRLTKRIILSQVARIFDPIGFTAPFVIRAKIGLQRLWEEGLDWDSELSEQSKAEWIKLFQKMEDLKEIKFERCITPSNAVGKPILCIFCDASMDAFGACAYLRWQTLEGPFEVRFLTGKSRVAPLKQLTIPRLELQAAVLASRMYTTLKTEMTIECEEVIFMTDSMIALSWIKGRARSYKLFVSLRVGEIQSTTDPSQWRHIPGDANVADELSRGVSPDQLNGRWRQGPDFLRRPKTEWPAEAKLEGKFPDTEKEVRKERSVLSASKAEDIIDCKRFSNWRRLVRVISYVLKFIRKLKSKCKRGTGEDNEVINNTLTPTDMQKGETYLIKCAQRSLKSRVDKGELKTLSPYTDEVGIIRVGGRVDRAEMPFAMKHPALLPYEHWISTLITRHVHENGHHGVASTTAKTRRKYWILKGHNLAKTIKFRCTTCRAFEHRLESQEMAELPRERLQPHSPPFHVTACDYFGPLTVKIGRNKTTKHYGALFTCLNTRAVHLELATDCSTMEFLQVLRRFFAIRGQPAKMISDNGTQFVGAEHELRTMVKGWSESELKDFCADKGTEWMFITPAAPHQNGCAESLVKSCKHALKKSIGGQILSPFELYTCLLEVANLVNQRPIGRIPTDPDDGSYLSPNDMLLGRASSEVAQGPFRETKNPRHRVELVQSVVDSFWQHWTRDVLPLLAPRWKWNTDRRNVRVDDIVMMTDSNSVRGKWTIARVVQVYPGQDGKGRNVRLKTLNAEYRRPVTKIALIYPAEGYED